MLQHLIGWVKPAAMKGFQYRPLRSVMCWRIPQQPAGRKIALTFDDGPHPEHTNEVRELLAEHSVRATFFVIGQQIEEHPDVFQRVVDDGHEIGVHGYVHNNREMPRQVLRTLDILAEFGVRPSLFRPPNGVIGLQTQLWMATHDFTTVLWSFDCRDSMRHEGKPGDCDRLSSIRPGEILLLHDDNPLCIEDLGRLLNHFEANDLEPHVLSDLLGS
jgi:peptidoglycan/xylan/chitin deacetylase (PgdA/CDA1 family)